MTKNKPKEHSIYVYKLFIEADFPTFQSGSRSDDKKEYIRDILKEDYHLNKGQYIFNKNDSLWARIFYFTQTKAKQHKKDTHNVIKPLLDAFEGFIYKDDQQILHFEGTRLEMKGFYRNPNRDSAIIIKQENEKTMKLFARYLNHECCWVEIGKLPPKNKMMPESNLEIDWQSMLITEGE